ncbi:MAG: hypothetical protein KJ058_02610 [Thermoanaerobaculia bacterium]|nr:hypothetical protein [Thermoanaerobaculia bacterium]
MNRTEPKRRSSSWSRALLACGCLLLLGLGACGVALWKGVSFLGARAPELTGKAGAALEAASGAAGDLLQEAASRVESSADLAEERLRARWAELSGALSDLQTDEGARRLWRANPALAERFGSEEEFVARARQWRPKVARDLPAWDPAAFEVKPFLDSGRPGVEIAYANRRGSRVRLVWRGTELSYIEVQ